uniref:Complement component 8, gamma polypeptide n=1 Tax=Oryzias latipes TaxID=8090 RepID=A0A3B3IJV8_ORYLA
MVKISCCTLLLGMLICSCLWSPAETVGGAKSRPRPQRRPKKQKVNPVDENPPASNIDIQQMTGTWYLLIASSKCPYLLKHGTNVQPTVMTLTRSSASDQILSVSTKTRHNHQCWEIKQEYHLSPVAGRLTLKGQLSSVSFLLNDTASSWREILLFLPGDRPERNTEIVIGETDYTSYAVIYYHKQGQVTVKLYSRSVETLSEPMLTKFEQLAEKQGFGLAYHFSFPDYSRFEFKSKHISSF